MLTALRIGNFKAFADTQTIPLRPLTLVFGPNSSGKSSIIHSLLLARHAQDTGELDTYRTDIGGESVDLGGFRQYVHKRDVSKRVEWTGVVDTTQLSDRLAELCSPVKLISVSITIGIALNNYGTPLLGAVPDIYSFELSADGESVLRLSRRTEKKHQIDLLNTSSALLNNIINALVLSSTTSETISDTDLKVIYHVIEEVIPELQVSIHGIFPSRFVSDNVRYGPNVLSLFAIDKAHREDSLANAVRLLLPRSLEELVCGVSNIIAGELAAMQYLGPLRSYPPRHLAFSQYYDSNWFAGGGYAWDIVRKDAKIREQVNAWLNSEDRMQTKYELRLRELVGIDEIVDPITSSLEQLDQEDYALDYEYSNPDDSSPETICSIKDPGEIAEQIRFSVQENYGGELSELILIDRNTNTAVSHRDVGIGVSQVLPVLVSAYAEQGKIVLIEQPEIHLHPALQAELADVFIESALGESRNRFILETHSEHLILRVLRRIRETTDGELPEGTTPIRPCDVAVIYVEPSTKGAIVIEIPVTDDGDFARRWPRGFFAEREQEWA